MFQSLRGRLCLRAAAELEERKCEKEKKLKEKRSFIEQKLTKELGEYREMWAHQRVGFYDGFREHKRAEDFKANVTRLEIAGVWDEIIEKLRNHELPDEFEADREWVDLGTRCRELVEPLDIANYYRHGRHYEDDASSYMVKGRPKRYRYPQRWLEHAQRRPREAISTSCFWAEVEELRYKTANGDASYRNVEERVVGLVGQIEEWCKKGELAKDVFLEGSTFVKWWKTLHPRHKNQPSIISLIGAWHQTNLSQKFFFFFPLFSFPQHFLLLPSLVAFCCWR